MSDERAEALRRALFEEPDPAALDAAAQRELGPAGGFRLPPRGDDPEKHVEPKIESEEDRTTMRHAWVALARVFAERAEPRAVLLDPEQWPDATGMLGLPIERRPLGLGRVRIATKEESDG